MTAEAARSARRAEAAAAALEPPSPTRRRILLVVRHPVGGIRTFLRYVYRGFDPGRYAFTLVAPDLPETRLVLEDLRELEIEYVPVAPPEGSLRLLRTVIQTMRGRRIDLVHSHGFTSDLCALPGALLERVPHVTTCHDVLLDSQFRGRAGPLKRVALALGLSMTDRICCVSHDAHRNLLEQLRLLGLWKHKVRVIPNGVETARFLTASRRDLRSELGLPDDAFVVGFLGRFMSQKGFRYLVDAMAQLSSRSDLPRRAVVLAFGQDDGFHREERESVRRRGLAESIRFLPFEANVASTLKGLDVVAVPSLWEACPLLPMEAMIAGVPLIGTDCIGLREVLRDTPATVVPAADATALAQALAREMIRPTREQAARFAPRAAARFDVTARAAEFERELRSHLRG